MCALLFFAGSSLAVRAQLAATTANQVFTSPDLGFSVLYPAALTHQDPAQLGQIEFALFALPAGGANASSAAGERCSHVVLAVGSGLDSAEDRLDHRRSVAVRSRGTLTITEINRACVGDKSVDDTLLAKLLANTRTVPGMQAIGRLTTSYVQGSTVFWSASTGYLKDARGQRSAAVGTTIAGTGGASVNGHLLIWNITASDPETFNRMSGFSVCFHAPTCPEGFSRLANFQFNLAKTAE